MSVIHRKDAINNSLHCFVPLLLAASKIFSNTSIASLISQFSDTIESELYRASQACGRKGLRELRVQSKDLFLVVIDGYQAPSVELHY